MRFLEERFQKALEAFSNCAVCPGNCISRCPLFRASRLRVVAPIALGRIGYRALKLGEKSLARGLVNCTGCRECEKVCPIHNPLPEAIRLSRRFVEGFEARPLGEPKAELLGSGSTDRARILAIASPLKPSKQLAEFLSRIGFIVYWVNTEAYTLAYWMGRDARISMPGNWMVVVEDLDAPVVEGGKAMSVVEFIEEHLAGLISGPLRDIVLHIPCKLDKQSSARLRKLLDASKVVEGCSGAGGGLLANNWRLASLVASNAFYSFRDLAIVSSCAWSVMALRRLGFKAYTVLEAIASYKESNDLLGDSRIE